MLAEQVEQVDELAALSQRWESRVRERAQNKCMNCGAGDTEHLRVSMIVPEKNGGQRVMGNGVLLCRHCELARGVREKRPKRSVNLWVSSKIHGQLLDQRKDSLGSMSALVRHLTEAFVRDPSRFEDLAHYQDDSRDVRVNLWLDADIFPLFRDKVTALDMTVTSAIKALVLMYASQRSDG